MKVGLIAGDGSFPLEVAKSIYQQEKKEFQNPFLKKIKKFLSLQ